ncbi:MAG: ECF transporter S component [Clostridia bacterium]|nr:ECF transporter S component [Clostridia bacterium]
MITTVLFDAPAPTPKPTFSETLAKTFASAKANLSFLGVCLLIFVGIFITALLFEKWLVKSRRKLSDTRSITYIALFSAMAGVLMLLEFPLPFAPGFYKLDFSEVPIMICTFYLGPVAGVISELIKIILKLFIKGTSTAFVGDFANFVVGCAFVLPASVIYHAKPGMKSAVIGLAAGTLTMTVFGSAFNALYLIPKFAQLFHMPLEAIVSMGTEVNKAIVDVPTLVMYAVVPFNLLKGVVVSVISFFLYKAVAMVLKLPAVKTKKAV